MFGPRFVKKRDAMTGEATEARAEVTGTPFVNSDATHVALVTMNDPPASRSERRSASPRAPDFFQFAPDSPKPCSIVSPQ